MRKLIINADDFGYSRAVNLGILKAMNEEAISSTTVLANGVAFNHAINVYDENIGLGIHLNLTEGKSLVSGNKFDRFNIYKIVLGVMDPVYIEKELRKQIENLLEIGIVPTHVDSHQHIHAFSPVKEKIINLAKEYNISKIRWQAPESESKFLLNMGFLKMKLVTNRLGLCPLITTDNFFGIIHTGNPNVNNFLSYLNFSGSAEICTHIGIKSNYRLDPLYKARPKELKILCGTDFKSAIKEKEIKLIHFGQL
jgi:chitin disaccharide deacetylase